MLTNKQLVLIQDLAKHLTGADSSGEAKRELLGGNIRRRMNQLGEKSLEKYLKLAEDKAEESAYLISALTIHTTSWFRENPHYVRLQQILLGQLERREVFKVWCSAVSTGEELYSFALVLEEFRRVHPNFDYCIIGTDIDPLSLEVAERAIYEQRALSSLVLRYKEHLLFGSGETDGLFTLSAEIRKRCQFERADLRRVDLLPQSPFDLIVCRNVLIYFDHDTVQEVMARIGKHLKNDGHLMIGHAENFDSERLGLKNQGHSVYARTKPLVKPISPVFDIVPSRSHQKGRKALVIDDVGVARYAIESLLKEIGFDTVAANSTAEASEAVSKEKFDLITLDLNLPEESGFSWLKRIRDDGLQTPIILISEVERRGARKVFEMLDTGAQEYIEKQSLRNDPNWVKEVILNIAVRPKNENREVSLSPKNNQLPDFRPEILLMGASTGGPNALVRLLQAIDKRNLPPVVVVQHISDNFLRPFADRIAESSGLTLGPCQAGEVLKGGSVYLALNPHHLGVAQKNGQLILTTQNSAPLHGHIPSVDHLFVSALTLTVPTMAVLMTGMGVDGAKGLLHLRHAGAFTMAQSQEDSVVFGMPREAIALGAAKFVGNVQQIAEAINTALASEASRVKNF